MMNETTSHSEISVLITSMLEGDRRSLSKLISLIDHDHTTVSKILTQLNTDKAEHSYCIGITGPPGAGKSTIVDCLISILTSENNSVGVIAVDPSSNFTYGAILGDRIRMSDHVMDPNVFIRSMATRGDKGGISKVTSAAVRILKSFGFDYIIIESVGAGQTQLQIADLSDTVIVTLVPEAGDNVQILKAGLLEIGDILIVNKADRTGANRIVNSIKEDGPTTRSSNWWEPPVLLTEANRCKGIDDVYIAIENHRKALVDTDNLVKKRQERNLIEFNKVIQELIDSKIRSIGNISEHEDDLISKVESGELDPYSGAIQAIGYTI